MNNIKQYYDDFQHKLINDFVQGNLRIVEAIKFITSFLHQKDPRKIIDIGCGIGWTTYEFSRAFPKASVLGIDLSDKLVNTANSIFRAPNLKYGVNDITKDFWRLTGKYDVITLVDVFEHIPAEHRRAFYENMKLIVSDKFTLLLTCPTKLHQNHLRNSNPEYLQPIDEDVDIKVLQEFAEVLGGEIIYYCYKSIWSSNDYLHAIITNDISYLPVQKHRVKVGVLSKLRRMRMVRNTRANA